MSDSVEAIVAEAVQLPPDQRLTLAHKILSSVEPEPSAETDAAWDREIRERMARYDAGELQAIPAAEVFAELDCRLRQCYWSSCRRHLPSYLKRLTTTN